MGPHSPVETLNSDVCKEISPDDFFCIINSFTFFKKAAFQGKYYVALSLELIPVKLLRYFSHRNFVNEPAKIYCS